MVTLCSLPDVALMGRSPSREPGEMHMSWRDIGRLALFGAAALLVLPARAITVSGPAPALTFSCTGLSYDAAPDFVFALNRDNTGANAESYDSEIIDGNGNVLWRFSRTLALGPGGVVFSSTPDTLTYGFTAGSVAAPTANPITYRLVSLAGNGLPQQIAFTASGACDTLPPAPTPGVAAVPTMAGWTLWVLSGVLLLWGAGVARRRPSA